MNNAWHKKTVEKKLAGRVDNVMNISLKAGTADRVHMNQMRM